MNKQEQESWDALVEGAKAVKLDHVPQKAIEDLFSTFIKDADTELGAGVRKADRAKAWQAFTWLGFGLLYLAILVVTKHGV